MLTPFSPAQIEQFRREAKKLSRTSEVSHSEALDSIAGRYTYRNWSQLMKHNPDASADHPATQGHFRLSRSVETMQQAIRKSPDVEDRRHSARSETAMAVTRDICQDLVSPTNALDLAVDYMEILLQVPRFHIHVYSMVRSEMRYWLPYCVHPIATTGTHILVNREYKPVGHITDARVPYEQFPHLHLQLSKEQLRNVTAPSSSEGYLFNDGCSPWWSRKDAECYLEQLHLLRGMLP